MSNHPIVEAGSISEFIWDEKYRFKKSDGTPIDQTVDDTMIRVADAISKAELDDGQRQKYRDQFAEILSNFEFIPAGRILAGAGTGRDVTLCNCYVMGDIEDSLTGIMHSLSESAATLKTGGGIGMNFSTLRPRGALVAGVDSVSSGSVSFMDMWNSMCGTIMSAGSRRGAMMGTLGIWHPDIEEFIDAKKEAGRLTNFNVSVLVTDAFMNAVEQDAQWDLHFNGVVYKTVRARELWDKILRSTYDYAEPGVIFIDRINNRNPLASIEKISATNPCGEQPLPPYGACVLGSLNLTQFVRMPFTPNAEFDYNRIGEVTELAVRFLDNVITVSKYPLEAQRIESINKRRIGIGVTGLADAMIMMGLSYRHDGPSFTRSIMETMDSMTRMASEELAKSRGHYPLWDSRQGPMRRNSHLLSIAPTGTISCFAGNVSSGIEPVFDFSYARKVLLPDGSRKTILCEDYARKLHRQIGMQAPDNNVVWTTATDLTTDEHLAVVSAAQDYVDSAISKTINCSPDMSFEEFGNVYSSAYRLGLKGCTTYRPSGVRGAVLEKIAATPAAPAPEPAPEAKSEASEPSNVIQISPPLARPEKLRGSTYKIKPGDSAAVYVTINDIVVDGVGRPFEIFFSTKAVECQAWMTALSRMTSAVFRKGGDVRFIIEELTSVYDPHGGFWGGGKYIPSVAAAIGGVIREHLDGLDQFNAANAKEQPDIEPKTDSRPAEQTSSLCKVSGKICPKCNSGIMVRTEGCWGCNSCSYSKC